MATDFQINLKEQRKRTGHTQQEVADACGISKSTYCQYESGDRHPRIATIKRLAAYLQISTDLLIGNEENEFSKEEKDLIYAYRKHPEMQNAIKHLLEMEGN